MASRARSSDADIGAVVATLSLRGCAAPDSKRTEYRAILGGLGARVAVGLPLSWGTERSFGLEPGDALARVPANLLEEAIAVFCAKRGAPVRLGLRSHAQRCGDLADPAERGMLDLHDRLPSARLGVLQ